MTETSIIATLTSPHDILLGSSGCLLPQVQARIIGPDGIDIETHDQPGEVLIHSPSVFIDYLGNTEPRSRTFTDDGWLRTGDIGLFRTSPSGSEHLFIVDRLKDMIKVKVKLKRQMPKVINKDLLTQVQGNQVAPADIEATLLQHPAVVDAAVIGISDPESGEVPLAFVVRSPVQDADKTGDELKRSIASMIEAELSAIHWLGKRITLLEKIPRSQSGKILKKVLKDTCV